MLGTFQARSKNDSHFKERLILVRNAGYPAAHHEDIIFDPARLLVITMPQRASCKSGSMEAQKEGKEVI